MTDIIDKYITVLKEEKRKIEIEINDFINDDKKEIEELDKLEDKLKKIDGKIELIKQQKLSNQNNEDLINRLNTFFEHLQKEVENKHQDTYNPEYNKIKEFLDFFKFEKDKPLDFQTLLFNVYFSDYVVNGLSKTINKDQIKIYEDSDKLKSLFNALNTNALTINMFFYIIDNLDEPKTELCYLIDKQKINNEFIIKFYDSEQRTKSLKINSKNSNYCVIIDNKKISGQNIGQYKIQ